MDDNKKASLIREMDKASYAGDAKKIKELLQIKGCEYDYEDVLCNACTHGSVEIINLLLPFTTRKNCNNALVFAILSDKKNCIDALFDHCDYYTVKNWIEERKLYKDLEEMQTFKYFEMKIKSLEDKKELNEQLSNTVNKTNKTNKTKII